MRREAAAEERRASKAAAAEDRLTMAEEARRQKEQGHAEAAAMTAAVTARVATFEAVLAEVLALPELTPDRLAESTLAPDDGPMLEPAETPPSWQDFAPREPGLFGRRRYEREAAKARVDFEAACRGHRQRMAERRQEVAEAYRARREAARSAARAEVDTLLRRVEAEAGNAIARYGERVLDAVTPLTGFITGRRALYRAEPRELVIEVDLPDTDVVPEHVRWTYRVQRQEIEPTPRRPADSARIYADLVSRLVLAAMHVCLRATSSKTVDLITLNGHVPTVDSATGRAIRPCVVTITSSRSTFADLVLDSDRLKPAECLQYLGAELSRHPFQLEPVPPVIDFDRMAQYAVLAADAALTEADHREDLMDMDPFKFETLGKDLFTAMGYRTWRTQPSHDDGIDAVAVLPHAVTPIECVIQAKRVRAAVPPRDVQALMGAMAEHGSATHGVLVTTSWLSDRSRQRAQVQRIRVIDRDELGALIQEHLNRKVVISTRPPRRAGTS
ncbi:restriction endonuclease [Pseudonocardia sulfidoxydans]